MYIQKYVVVKLFVFVGLCINYDWDFVILCFCVFMMNCENVNQTVVDIWGHCTYSPSKIYLYFSSVLCHVNNHCIHSGC